MKTRILSISALALLTGLPTQVNAQTRFVTPDTLGGTGKTLQCVPYARQISGIHIYGDAHTWWGQASGRYARGSKPQVGAVMAVRPYANSVLGHVAAVSRIIDSRTILIRHANWSEPGLIEDNVKAVDVSDSNDWSEVRIWHKQSQGLGTSHWPVAGFIYNQKPGLGEETAAPRSKTATKSIASSARKARSNDLIADIIAKRHR